MHLIIQYKYIKVRTSIVYKVGLAVPTSPLVSLGHYFFNQCNSPIARGGDTRAPFSFKFRWRGLLYEK